MYGSNLSILLNNTIADIYTVYSIDHKSDMVADKHYQVYKLKIFSKILLIINLLSILHKLYAMYIIAKYLC